MTAATPIAIPSIERKDRRRWARRAPWARWRRSRTGYLPESAATGSRRVARRAGRTPKTPPTATEREKAATTAQGGGVAGSAG